MSAELKYSNLKISLNNWICSLKNAISQIDKEENPITHKTLSRDLEASQALYYEMTGQKSSEFKELCK